MRELHDQPTVSVAGGSTAGRCLHDERGDRVGPCSARSLVQALLRDPAFARFTGWGGGVQRSELTRSALRMFDAEFVTRGEARVSSHHDLLSARHERVAREVLVDLTGPLVLVATMTAGLLTEVAQQCEAAGVAVSLDQISGRCTSAATSHVRREWREPTRAELVDAADRITNKVLASVPRLWSAEQFEARFAPQYDAQWRCRGGLNLAAYPPSLLLLGHDERPPLTRRDSQETDACGTNRSVYSRYASYRPPGRGQPVPFRSRATRCTQPVTLRSTSRDVASEEVNRACLPYGLDQQSHRTVLRGTFHGLAFDGEGTRTAVGEDLSGRCVPLNRANEVDIAETVRRVLQRRYPRRSQAPAATAIPEMVGMHIADDGLDPTLLAGQLDRVARVVTRRLWKALHGLELYVEEHICSCSLKALVSVALDRAVPSARLGWNDPCGGPSTETASDLFHLTAEAGAAAALLEAQNRTCELLMGHPDIASAVLTLNPGWRATYLELVAGDPDSYLPADEFARWCRDVVPGVRRTDEEAS